MNYDIRRLDAVTDRPLFEQMYTWLETSPQWRKQTEALFGTLDRDDYLAAVSAPHRCDIGIFVEGELTACVTLTMVAKDLYEVHFEAHPNTDPAVVIAAGQDIRDQMFGWYGMNAAFTWTPTWNRTVLGINRAIGFQDDGVRMLHGSVGNRTIEWVRQSIEREQ